MTKFTLLAGVCALVFAFAGSPAFAANSESDTSGTTSTSTASESGGAGQIFGSGIAGGGATVTATNLSADNSASSFVGGVASTSTSGGTSSTVTGGQFDFALGGGLHGAVNVQSGNAGGSATGTSSASHHFP
jgi:hypothetical protein